MRLAPTSLAFLCSLALTGCAVTSSDIRSSGNLTPGIDGSVHGGQQAVANANLQVFYVGTSSDAAGATSLLTTTTNTHGNFTFPAFTCTSPSALTYLVVTQGNPGLAAGTNNQQIALMAALGPCSSLGSSYIAVNELTTVAAAYALAPFMAASTHIIGSGPSDSAALSTAFNLAAQYVNPTTGATPGTGIPSGYSAPIYQLATIADIIATCVNTSGLSLTTSTPCSTLFGLATPNGGTTPADTIDVLFNLANNPTLSTGPLYGLVTTTAPYLPDDVAAPTDLSLALVPNPSGSLVSVSQLNFAATHYNQTSTLPITITANSGDKIVFTVTGYDNYGTARTSNVAFSASSTCYGSCTATISFSPTSTNSGNLGNGSTSGSLQISDIVTGQTSTVVLQGTAGIPAISLSASPVAFGTIYLPNSKTLPETITNTGDGILFVFGYPILGPSPATTTSPDFSVNSTVGTDTVAPGGTYTLNIAFTPTATGTRDSVLQLQSNTPSTPLAIPVTGSGATSPDATSVTFPSAVVGIPAAQTTPINGAITISSLALSGTNPGDFTLEHGCNGITVALGTSCPVIITFTPSAVGTRTATLTVTPTSGSPIPISLSGTGTTGVQLTPSTGSFHPYNGSQAYTLANGNSTALTISSVTVSSTSYQAQSTCGASLAPLSACTIYVDATSLTAPAGTYTLTVTDSDTSSPQTASFTASLPGSGSVYTPVVLELVGKPYSGTDPFINYTNDTVLGGLGSSDFTIGSCSNNSCPYTFTPSAPGYRSAITTAFPLVGFGIAPVGGSFGFELNDDFDGTRTLEAGVKGINSTSNFSATVLQSGLTPLALSFATPASPLNSGEITFNTSACSSTIAAATSGTTNTLPPSCTITGTFAPTAYGTRSASLIVTDTNSGRQETLTFVATSADIAPVGYANPLTLPSTNPGTPTTGTDPFTVNPAHATSAAIAAGSNAAFSISGSGTCAAGVSSCPITVSFNPVAAGTVTGTLNVTDTTTGLTSSVGLTGTGLLALKLSPSYLGLGYPFSNYTGTYAASGPVTLSNIGNTSITISSYNFSNSSFTQTNNCPSPLPGGSSCTITVSVASSTTYKNITGTLTVSSGAFTTSSINLGAYVGP